MAPEIARLRRAIDLGSHVLHLGGWASFFITSWLLLNLCSPRHDHEHAKAQVCSVEELHECPEKMCTAELHEGALFGIWIYL